MQVLEPQAGTRYQRYCILSCLNLDKLLNLMGLDLAWCLDHDEPLINIGYYYDEDTLFPVQFNNSGQCLLCVGHHAGH